MDIKNKKIIYNSQKIQTDNLDYFSKGIEKLVNENKDAKSDVGNFSWMVIEFKKWLDSKK